MRTHKHRTLGNEDIQKILESISDKSNTLETLALKGHLFIEYWLNEAISEHMDGSGPLLQTLNFHQKCMLAKALRFIEKAEFYDQLAIINQIRNRYAHTLLPAEVVELIAKLPLQKTGELGERDDLETLRTNVAVVFITLAFAQLPKSLREEMLLKALAVSSS